MKTRLALGIVLLLVACSSPKTPTIAPTASAANPSAPMATTLAGSTSASLPPLVLTPSMPASGQVTTLSGNAPATGVLFTITANSMLRVNWQQASTGDFVMAVTNTDSSQVGTPNGRVVFEDITGPSAMFSDYDFIPGKYQIVVESADGPWKVWIQYLGPGQ